MTIIVPTKSEELEEMLHDDAKMTEVVTTGGIGEFVKNYMETHARKNGSVADEVRAETQKALAEFMAANGLAGKPPVDFAPHTSPEGGLKNRIKIHNHGQTLSARRPYNSRAIGAGADKMFGDAEEFYQAIWHKQQDRALIAKRDELQTFMNAFGSMSPADGGFLIPEVLRDELLSVALEDSVVRPRARVIPMSALRLPFPAVDSTTNQGSVFGGITTYWTEESAALVGSSGSFARVVLEAKKLIAYSDIPNELIADAPAFSQFVDMAFPTAIAFQEDVSFFTGTGVAEPLGWINSLATIKYDAAVSAQVAWSDVVGMYARMLPSSLSRAVWLCSPDTFPQLGQMTFGTGQFPALVPIGGGGGDFVYSLLGRPVIVTEKNPKLTVDGALSFVDFGYYLIGDRATMQASSSVDYKFANDQTSFRVIERVDGRPWILSAITPANGSANTLSPFVQLTALHT